MKITSIEQQKRNKNRYSVYVDGKYIFSLEDIDVVKLKIKVGQEISESDIEFYVQTYELTKAKDRALSYISFKRRTKAEVRKKLEDLGYSPEIVERVIEGLINLRYLDDEEYAKLYINEKTMLRPSGKRLLKMELRNKGLDEQTIEEKLEESDIDEYKLAYGLASKKIEKIRILDKKEMSKVYAMLMRKGFSSSVAMKVLKDIEQNH